MAKTNYSYEKRKKELKRQKKKEEKLQKKLERQNIRNQEVPSAHNLENDPAE